jgi:hypothetical protein
LPRKEPPVEPHEPDVRRWPRAWRMIFVLAAGVAAWVLVVVAAGFLWRRMGH